MSSPEPRTKSIDKIYAQNFITEILIEEKDLRGAQALMRHLTWPWCLEQNERKGKNLSISNYHYR
jgi:hypothetical protein